MLVKLSSIITSPSGQKRYNPEDQEEQPQTGEHTVYLSVGENAILDTRDGSSFSHEEADLPTMERA